MPKPEYIDIHSHLNFKDFDADRDEVIQRLKDKKIWTITVGTDLKSSQEAVDLADKHENLFACVGLHPADNSSESFDEKAYEKLVSNKKVVAIGECGLDYFKLPENSEQEKKRQKLEFEKQIGFAVVHNKPLMIHCRDAYPDALEILKSKQKEYGEKVRGNFHFFTSPIEIAQKCLDIGFTVSFTGPITFANYNALVEYVPLARMMIETDSPYAAPIPYRGKRNSPEYVEEIAHKIAEIKKLNIDIVKDALRNTTFQLFFNSF